jgi:hypothetical protein
MSDGDLPTLEDARVYKTVMSTLRQKVEAISWCGAVAEQTLQKLIGLHVQKYGGMSSRCSGS